MDTDGMECMTWVYFSVAYGSRSLILNAGPWAAEYRELWDDHDCSIHAREYV